MKSPQNINVYDSESVTEYERCLVELYGAIIAGKDLRHVLGYKTGAAFRKAVQRNSLPITTFIPNGRRARAARTRDIAKWLVSIDSKLDSLKQDIQDCDSE